MFNISKIRKKIPTVNNLIYLDNAAVAPIHNKTREILDAYLDHFLNYGIKDYTIWFEKIEQTRSDFAKFLGAESDEVAFIKNTSAGISAFAQGIEFKKGDNVIIPDIEFPANVYPWLNLERKGVEVKFLKAENGTINLEQLEKLIDSNTRVVSISWIEFLNGYRNDLKSISNICKEKSREFGRKIYFCVDVIQGLGALKLDLKEIDIDFLAADGHKWFLALEGAGILYCNKKIIDEVQPVSVGWKSVSNPLDFTNINFELEKSARKFEEGSMNVAGILSLKASLDLFNEFGIENIEKRVLQLTDTAIKLLQERNIEIVSSLDPKHRSGIVSFKTADIEKDYDNLTSNNVQLSKRGGLLRISPHFYNTEEELEKFATFLNS